MALASFSIGSNIDREKNVGFAVKALRQKFSAVTFSPIYETRSVGFKGDDFFNLVGQFETRLSIADICTFFGELEKRSGRSQFHQPFEDRTLDLDLLLYDDRVIKSDRFTLPHPDVLDYDFVLMPLSRMMPDFVHPDTGLTLAEQWYQRDKVHRFHKSDTEVDDL